MQNIEVIFFDFDGVIIDSMPVRDFGFYEIFKEYDRDLVDQFIEYHQRNGGLSRFIKIRYFFENILKSSISNNEVEEYASQFSLMMKSELVQKKYLINETINFIKNVFHKYPLYIVSGSENEELNFLCKELNIDSYFKAIYGSPTSKDILVKNILEKNKFDNKRAILIGDSINDYDAAMKNKIYFYGYNNRSLVDLSFKYISSFDNLDFL